MAAIIAVAPSFFISITSNHLLAILKLQTLGIDEPDFGIGVDLVPSSSNIHDLLSS